MYELKENSSEPNEKVAEERYGFVGLDCVGPGQDIWENARTRNFAGGMSQRDIDTFLRGGGNKAPLIKYFPKI